MLHSLEVNSFESPIEFSTGQTGHAGCWTAEKMGSKGEIQGAGLVPISLNPDSGDDRIRNGSKPLLTDNQYHWWRVPPCSDFRVFCPLPCMYCTMNRTVGYIF